MSRDDLTGDAPGQIQPQQTSPRKKMLIRQATLDDPPAILALYAQPSLDDGQCLTLGQAAEIFHAMETYPSYQLFVAEQDTQVVGTFALLIMENLDHLGKPSGLVEDVAVAPSHQGTKLPLRNEFHNATTLRNNEMPKIRQSRNPSSPEHSSRRAE